MDVIVKAKPEFKTLRNDVLGLDKKIYRALQAGKECKIRQDIYEKYIDYFDVIKNLKEEVKKNGD